MMLHIKHIDTEYKSLHGSVKYDKIVDKSDFRPDANVIRDKRLSASMSGGDVGLYDFTGKKDDHVPTQIEIDLRNGVYDKAEIQRLISDLQQQAKAESDATKKAELTKKLEQLNKVRQQAIDTQLGISNDTVNSD